MQVAKVNNEKNTTLPRINNTTISGCADNSDRQLVGVLDPVSLKNVTHTEFVRVNMNERIHVRMLTPPPPPQELQLPGGTPIGK